MSEAPNDVAILLASQRGIIIDIRNNVRDYQKVGDYSVDWKTRHIAGNYITIKHDNEEEKTNDDIANDDDDK